MSEFMGMNVKSWAIRNYIPQYTEVLSQFRDYHSVTWDIQAPGNDATFPTGYQGNGTWPNWIDEYEPWKDGGVRTNMCLQFEGFTASSWTATNAYKYGNEVGEYFGAGGGGAGLVGSIQIGNEPNRNTTNSNYYSDANYVTVVRNMAQGIRAADPNMLIVTANVRTGSSNDYARSVNLLKNNNLLPLVDVLATHTYPNFVPWPTYEKTYPEDTRSGFGYLQDVRDLITWRNANAPGKQVWVTEFGYDAPVTAPPAGTQFKPVTLNQQAQYLVRSYFAFAEMGVDRAYMYYYNDSDVASLHEAAGLTSNFTTKKPSYYAVKHMNETLRDYRFEKIITQQTGNLFVHEYQHGTDLDSLIWAIWSPTGSGRTISITLSDLPGDIELVEQMPLAAGTAPLVGYTVPGEDQIRLTVGESPIYLHMQVVPEPTALAALSVLGMLLSRRQRERASLQDHRRQPGEPQPKKSTIRRLSQICADSKTAGLESARICANLRTSLIAARGRRRHRNREMSSAHFAPSCGYSEGRRCLLGWQ